MKAIVQDRFGSPDVLEIREVDKPVPGEGEVLMTLTEFIEDGRITPVIDRRFPLEELPAAMRYQEAGHASGKVVIAL